MGCHEGLRCRGTWCGCCEIFCQKRGELRMQMCFGFLDEQQGTFICCWLLKMFENDSDIEQIVEPETVSRKRTYGNILHLYLQCPENLLKIGFRCADGGRCVVATSNLLCSGLERSYGAADKLMLG